MQPCETHKLLAIMSSIKEEAESSAPDGVRCRTGSMLAEIVALHKAWICGKAPDMAGCKP